MILNVGTAPVAALGLALGWWVWCVDVEINNGCVVWVVSAPAAYGMDAIAMVSMTSTIVAAGTASAVRHPSTGRAIWNPGWRELLGCPLNLLVVSGTSYEKEYSYGERFF